MTCHQLISILVYFLEDEFYIETKITCYRPRENVYELLPVFKNTFNVHAVTLKDCPMFPNKSFIQIFGEELDREIIHKSIYQIHADIKYTRIYGGLKRLAVLNLENNELTSLDSNVFEHLQLFNKIYLSENKFKNISVGFFKHSKHLSEFILTQEKTKFEFLPAGLLANLTKLEKVTISCGLKELPEDLFEGSENITKIILDANKLQSLPNHIFRDQNYLVYLSMSNNQFKTFKW